MSQINVMDTLRARGFIKQTVYEDDLYKLLGTEKTVFYIGFDPTADSLHIGHYIPVMTMAHMQRAGHKPVVLIGGGTAMIGDPSNRTDMRAMMTKETIDYNVECFKKQLSKFVSFEGDNAAIIVNNADWLLNLNYVEFLRDFGIYFSVNKMLTAECFKSRLEGKGLNFLEFNYMLMQSYDFLMLYKKYGCKVQLGGDDQWSNILAGADAIRRKEGVDAFAFTNPLLVDSNGNKMGKTMKGALWLDAGKTTPYEFYQYFRNVEDAKVAECLRLLTFMELDKINELTRYNDERMNEAKKILAFEVTKLIHGEVAAIGAEKEALAAFSGDSENMPSAEISAGTDAQVAEIMVLCGAASSKSDARRLIEGGGVRLNETKVTDAMSALKDNGITEPEFVLHKGKKVHLKIILK